MNSVHARFRVLAAVTASRIFLLMAAVLSGCFGASEQSVTSASPTPDPTDPFGVGGTGTGESKLDCTTRTSGSSAVRRLTRREYLNTVRDLLQDPQIPEPELPVDGTFSLFVNNGGTPVSALAAGQYLASAEALSLRVASRLKQLVPCDPASSEAACTVKFVDEFGSRAFRRPLTQTEHDVFLSIYTAARTGSDDHTAALRWVVAAFLQSPRFLHHIEVGDPTRAEGELVPLTGYEIAARLSYFYWQTVPDDELRAAAASGALNTAEGIHAQATRLLADPRARAVVVDFHRQVLELDRLANLQKDATLFPDYTPQLKTSMKAETEAFIDFVYWEGDGKLSTLLTADYSFVDATLAKVYGAPDVTSTTPTRVQFPAGQRSGLLTQASFLSMNAHADQTSPVLRGKFVRERLLCQELAAPPPGVETIKAPEPGLTTRERFAEHSENPACGGCHVMMDPIGFGFENYDAVGAFRTLDNGLPVDASGELTNAGEVSGKFEGAVAMGAKLAQSRLVHACTAEQWLAWATQRAVGSKDACSVESLADAFFAAGGDLKALLLAIPTSDAFRYRAPLAQQEACE